MIDTNYLRRFLAAGGRPEDLGLSVDPQTGQVVEQPDQNALRDLIQGAGAKGQDVMSAPQAYGADGSPVSTVNGDFKVYAGDGMPQERTLTIPQPPQQSQQQAQQPMPAGYAPGGSRMVVGGGRVIQPQQGMTGAPMRVVGAGNGQTVDLSPEVAPAHVELDYSRAPVEVPGVGRAYYDKNGTGAYVVDGSGKPTTKVYLGYDMAGSMALNKADDEARQRQAQLSQTQAATAHTQEETRASKANNPDFGSIINSGGPGALPGTIPGATPDERLTRIDPSLAPTIKQMLDGRMQPPAGAAMRNPRVLMLMQVANMVDPSFDEATWKQRYSTAQDFSSAGKSGQTLTAFNTALEHLGTMRDAGNALNNFTGFPGATIANSIVNTVENSMGDPRITAFQAAKNALNGELTAAFNKGHITDAQLAKWGDTINSSSSPEQMMAAYKQFVSLLGSKLNELGNSYERGMSKNMDRSQFMSPQARKVYDELTGAAMPTTTGSAPQAKTFDSMPDPRTLAGKTLVDDASGRRYKSDGRQWIIQGS